MQKLDIINVAQPEFSTLIELIHSGHNFSFSFKSVFSIKQPNKVNVNGAFFLRKLQLLILFYPLLIGTRYWVIAAFIL